MRKLSLTSFTVSAIHALLVLISCVVRFVSVRPRVILWKSVFICHCYTFGSSGVSTFLTPGANNNMAALDRSYEL